MNRQLPAEKRLYLVASMNNAQNQDILTFDAIEDDIFSDGKAPVASTKNHPRENVR